MDNLVRLSDRGWTRVAEVRMLQPFTGFWCTPGVSGADALALWRAVSGGAR